LSKWRAIATPVLAGLGVRVALIFWTGPRNLSLDEERFWALAGSRMEGTAFLPPLYPFFLAAVRGLTRDDLLAARLLTAVLSLTSIALVFLLAERHLGEDSGRAPAWIAALLPGLAFFDGRLRSESLVVLLLLLFAWLWSHPRRDAWAPPIAAGLALGLIVLARPELLLLPPALAILALYRGAGVRSLSRAALLLPGILVLVLPAMVRSHRVSGVWAISDNGGYNLWKSFHPHSDGSQVGVMDFSIFDGVTEDRLDAIGLEAARTFVIEHPWRSLLLAPAKLGHLFGPERDLLSELRRKPIARDEAPAALVAALIQNAGWFILLAGGLFALMGPLRSPVKDLTLALLGTLVLVHLVFFGDGRFHMPLVPFLCIALPEAWDGSRRSAGAVRALTLGLATLGVAWCCIAARDLPLLAALWRG